MAAIMQRPAYLAGMTKTIRLYVAERSRAHAQSYEENPHDVEQGPLLAPAS